MAVYVRAPGVLKAPLGEGWVVFSSLSGETHLVNGESVAVLETLSPEFPLSAAQVCETLAHEYELQASELEATLAGSWGGLVEAGLIRPVAGP
jgi:PqqD family protein of HPr-rel-A system